MNVVTGKEPDGITYMVYFVDGEFYARVTHPNGRMLKDEWECAYPPRFGIDIADVDTGNAVLEKLITQIRKGA